MDNGQLMVACKSLRTLIHGQSEDLEFVRCEKHCQIVYVKILIVDRLKKQNA